MDNLKSEIIGQLVNNAVSCTYYVAFGKCMREDIAKKHGVEAEVVKREMDAQAVALHDYLKNFPGYIKK